MAGTLGTGASAPPGRHMGVQFLRVGIGGDNAFRLDVTEDEWTRYGLRQQLARYAQFLTSALRDAKLQPTGDNASEFTFTLGRGATLKFPLSETLDLRVDGKPVAGFQHPPVSASVAQCADADAEEWTDRADLVACGVGTFEDQARLASHRARVVAHGSNRLGGRVEAVIEPADHHAGMARGVVFWRYAVPDNAARTLAAHQMVTERFELTDRERTGLQVGLAVTVTGTPGEPVVAGRMEEGLGMAQGSDANHSVSGAVTFDDLVRAGMQGAALVPDAGNRLGGRLELVAHETAPQAQDAPRVVFWSYRLPWPALRTLTPGESRLERFAVSYVNATCGKPVKRRVTLSVTGTVGAPVIALVSCEPCHDAGAACGVTRRATAVVELTRSLWLSQPGVMLVGAGTASSASAEGGGVAKPSGPDRLARTPRPQDR